MSGKDLLTVKSREKNIELMAEKIANEAPELKDLTAEQLEQIAKIVITQNLTNELNLKSKLYRRSRRIF